MKKRIFFLFFLQIVCFLVVLTRLAELQLVEGEKNRILAEENRVKRVVLPAGRGIIYDRRGEPLVENIPLYRVRSENTEGEEYEVISRSEALEIEARGEERDLRIGVGRKYFYGDSLGHLLGFLGQVNQEEVSLEGKGLEGGDLIGRAGLEQEYELFLRGEKGAEIFEVDALGEKVRVMGEKEPRAGQDIVLSIDARVSKVAFEALEGRSGAVVATEAKTGQVIALVSSPSFDSNELSLGMSREKYQELLEDSQKPFFHRAISGVYPPASTFKIVTAVAGLEDGKIDREFLFEDTGVIRVGEFTYKNWYFTQSGRVEGKINVARALARSTDTFFYKLGEQVGASRLSDWGKEFGLGQKTAIDLPGEAAGLVPDPEWKERVRGERWFLGNTYHLAIGQSDLMTTPLQVNMLTGVIANGGHLCQPRVVLGSKEKEWEKAPCRDLKLTENTLAIIKEGMEGACSSGGTAFPLFDFSPQVACKTGTAEFSNLEDKTHAWLTGFAPADDPEIVVTVLVERGGEGSQIAAPIARKVFEAWFTK